MNKKGIILVELIFTIVIVSTISIFSMTLLYNLYKDYTNDFNNEVLKLESSSTQILLEKIFSNSLKVNVSGTKIDFYKVDTKLFNLGYYSKFVDLNSIHTNKASIFSPNTKAEELIDYSITFDDTNFYEIKNDSYGEIINFESNVKKEIKEQYKIVSKNHSLSYTDEKLYLDGKLLLENIKECSFSISLNILTISFKIDSTPITWKYNL